MNEMKNPYIVREADGEAYTIQKYVTGKPLDPSDMVSDEHGIYPVSPLGFMMKPDGTVLEAAPATKFVEMEGTGGEDPHRMYENSYIIEGKYESFVGRYPVFPVLRVSIDSEHPNCLDVLVDGMVDTRLSQSFRFMNASSDDYESTGLLRSSGFDLNSDSYEQHDGRTRMRLTIPDGVSFNGIVVEGKLKVAAINHNKDFATVVDDSNVGGAAVYRFGESDDSPYRRICSYYAAVPSAGSTGDNQTTCYASNGYSNREVSDWLESRIGSVTKYGAHPSSEEGNLFGAGAFVNWFVACGEVDVSGGQGRSSVMVPGFGLGGGMTGCPGVEKAPATSVNTSDIEHRLLTFGYGTKHDAMAVDVGKVALPQDWPFTDYSSYKSPALDNSITLIRHGALVDGKRLGKLQNIDTECMDCGGTGQIDGDTCQRCNGTGALPPCDMCEGTGKLDGATCPQCKGLGAVGARRYVLDRIHVCLYNDLSPSDATHGHIEDTTVLKKTFINLATPINTVDGEKFDITVSIPTVNLHDAFPMDGDAESRKKSLSGYYAYVTQPRVYVVSGTWQFSDTRVSFTIDRSLQSLTLSSPLLSNDGNALPVDTAVRVSLAFGSYKKKTFDVTGRIKSDTGILLDSALDVDGAVAAVLSEPPRKGRPNIICGAAYVEPNNDTLPNGMTNLGLNAVRSEDGMLGDDKGNGSGVEKYNKFYTSDIGDESRRHVLFDGNIPLKDQRQIVATVYPTVSNTFQWSVTGRRKLSTLDTLMTMDADMGVAGIDCGHDGMLARIFRMNQRIVERMGSEVTLTPEQYPMDINTDIVAGATEYSNDAHNLSLVGLVISLAAGENGDPSESTYAQPVRQAIKTVRMLADDYRKARTVRANGIESSDVMPDSAHMLQDAGAVDNTWDMNGRAASCQVPGAAGGIRLRSLANIVSTAGTSESGTPVSPILGYYPFIDDELKYYASNPYGFGMYDTTAMREDVQCSVCDANDTYVFAMNSLVDACLRAGLPWLGNTDEVDDLMRSAELEAVRFDDAPDDMLKPCILRNSMSWLEVVDAVARIASPDNIPSPEMPDGFSYADLNLAHDGDEEFISIDAYGYYKDKNSWDENYPGAGNFIATNMPTIDGMAQFLKSYIPGYAAGLPTRNWDGIRVRTTPELSSNPGVVELTRKLWSEVPCDDELRGSYAADTFLLDDANYDPNMNRIEFGDQHDSMAMNASAAPYAFNPGYRGETPFANERDPDTAGYIRVFMSFTFSANAGRWYCTDYRQAPISYLTPLYGGKALDETIDGKRVWVDSGCGPVGWRAATRHLYGELPPLDINPELVCSMVNDGQRRFVVPYLPVDEGGLGLSAPLTKTGERRDESLDAIRSTPHANFWSVRDVIRPASSVFRQSDIPAYYVDSNGKHREDADGIMSDSVLWGQYDYPAKHVVEYHLPDTEFPDADLTTRRLVYAVHNTETGNMDTGDVQVGPDTHNVTSVSNGSEHA